MKVKFKFNKKTVATVAVCLWGVFAVWYVLNDQWQDFKMNEKEQAYKLGVDEGKNWTIKKVIEETSKCQQQVPLTFDDTTVNVVSVECLQKVQAQQSPGQPSASQPSVEQGL